MSYIIKISNNSIKLFKKVSLILNKKFVKASHVKVYSVSFFLKQDNAECDYYILFIVFGIISFIEWYCVWLLQHF